MTGGPVRRKYPLGRALITVQSRFYNLGWGASPSPLDCKNEYVVFALGEGTAARWSVLSSRRFGPGSSEMSARSYSLHSVCTQFFSFFQHPSSGGLQLLIPETNHAGARPCSHWGSSIVKISILWVFTPFAAGGATNGGVISGRGQCSEHVP